MPQSYDTPAGWVNTRTARGPLLLVNAFAFAKSSNPPPDQWTHFAKLRPVPWRLVILFAAIAAFFAWGGIATLVQTPASQLGFGIYLIVAGFGVGFLFFAWGTLASVLSFRKRQDWPNLHGVGIGTTGVALRLTTRDSDVAWGSIAAIAATFTNLDNAKAHIPVLRIEYRDPVTNGDTHLDLNTQIIGTSPVLLYWALVYYWQNPGARSELGTTVAQQRMDGWLAQITGAPVAAA